MVQLLTQQILFQYTDRDMEIDSLPPILSLARANIWLGGGVGGTYQRYTITACLYHCVVQLLQDVMVVLQSEQFT